MVVPWLELGLKRGAGGILKDLIRIFCELGIEWAGLRMLECKRIETASWQPLARHAHPIPIGTSRGAQGGRGALTISMRALPWLRPLRGICGWADHRCFAGLL